MSRELMVACVVIAIFILNYQTLVDIIGYYSGRNVDGDTPKLLLLRNKESRIFSVLCLKVGFGLLISAIIPTSEAQMVGEYPKDFFTAISVFTVAGTLEEIIFRIIPFMIMFAVRAKLQFSENAERANLIVAVIVSLVFASVHITNYVNPDLGAYLQIPAIFILALPYWYLVEKDGLLSSTFAHVGFNVSGWIINYFFF